MRPPVPVDFREAERIGTGSRQPQPTGELHRTHFEHGYHPAPAPEAEYYEEFPEHDYQAQEFPDQTDPDHQHHGNEYEHDGHDYEDHGLIDDGYQDHNGSRYGHDGYQGTDDADYGHRHEHFVDSGDQNPGYQDPGFQHTDYQHTDYQDPGYQHTDYREPDYREAPQPTRRRGGLRPAPVADRPRLRSDLFERFERDEQERSAAAARRPLDVASFVVPVE